jgi:hypothetical protein
MGSVNAVHECLRRPPVQIGHHTGCQASGYSLTAGVSVSWPMMVPFGSMSQRSLLAACGSNCGSTISVPSGEKTGPDSDFENVSVGL